MVELLVVMDCGTATYKTETFKDKDDFIKAINNVQIGNAKLICFTDKLGKYVAVPPTNCVIECNDC
jgi:hypothetical protein